MIKSMKRKIIISFMMLMMLISTLVSYTSYAATVGESYKVYANKEGESYIDGTQAAATVEGQISYDEYINSWYIFCCQHGTHIPSELATQRAYTGNSYTPSPEKVPIEQLENYSEIGTSSMYVGKDYKTNKIAYYALRNTIICTPKTAFILNEATNNVPAGGSDDNYVQHAWWTTDENIGTKEEDNELSLAATAYQDFIKKIAKNPSDVENVETYKTLTHKYEDGSEISIKFPEIDEEKINSALSFGTSKVSVNFDTERQKYVIGPFSIGYEESSSNDVDFGVISGFDIYTDASTQALSKDQWRFVFTEEHKENDLYPNSGEEFYIEMDYIENATKITGMDVNYKYLITGGQYQELVGTYDRYKWVLNKTGIEESKDANGNYTQWQFSFSAVDQGLAFESQQLGLVNKAARWYETAKIQIRTKQATLKVEKKAVDENGNALSAEQIKDLFGENQYFDFRVKVTYNDGKVETNDVTVKAGSTATVGTYSWDETEPAPTFEVEEIKSSNKHWEINSVNNSKGSLKDGGTIVVEAVNKLTKPNSNKIEITKTISGVADTDEEFKFEVKVTMPNGKIDTTVASIVVEKGSMTGNTWSKEYTWYGDKIPTYEIKEIETEASKRYNPVINPSSGKLDGSGAVIKVNALNQEVVTEHKAYLTLEKDLSDGQITDELFGFDVKVEGVKNTENGVVEFKVNLKAGEKAGPYEFVWDGKKEPTFTIVETDNREIQDVNIEVTGANGVKKTGKQVTGKLVASEDSSKATNVNVKFTNKMEEHKGNIKVIKDFFSTEKMSSEELKATVNELNVKFDVEVTIKGTFVYGKEKIQNSTKVIKKTLSKDNNWQFAIDDIIWYGSNIPTFTVEETNMPEGWSCRSITYSNLENASTNTEGRYLAEGKTVEVKVVNEIPSETLIDLTFSMAGLVWVDEALDSKNDVNGDGYFKAPNGVYDKGETLKENAEVVVYKVVYDASGNEVQRTVAKAYKDVQNNEITFPILTKSDGKWNVPRIQVPVVTDEEKAMGYTASYDVEFAYDGQTYEPTEFLSYKVSSSQKDGYNKEYDKCYTKKITGSTAERAAEYINTTTAGKREYEKDSMAIEVSNNSNNIVEVSGKTAIDSNGDTTGVVTLSNGEQYEVTYHSDNAGKEYPTRSILNTTDSEGRVLDIFKAKATTSAGKLSFPFDVDKYDGSSLTSINKTIDAKGFHTSYKFIAVYNYCLNINLGLKAKEDVDIALTKNLDNAKVVVNEKMYQYKYSGYYDLTEEKVNTLNKDIHVDGAEQNIEYTLGLYKSDYYYRAEMYKNNEGVYNALETFYKSISKDPTDTEMDVYLTYKIKVQNSSSKYDVKVNRIYDYYDSTLTLVRESESKYLKTQTIGGQEAEVNAVVEVAKASDYAKNWDIVRRGIVGSDKDNAGNNVVYDQMIATDLGITLAPGESKEIMVTFKINKDKDDKFAIEDSIKLGQKCNVAEIASYSTFLKGTQTNAGKIDRDSAPGNVNITANNEKTWYEDDTFAAPRLKVNILGNSVRTVNGVVWEDNSNDKNTENPGYNQQVGNGIKDFGEKEIQGLTTELVEKVTVRNADGAYIEYDYIWPTDMPLDCLNGKTIEEVTGFDSTVTTGDNGKYSFENVVAGDYVVRFTYGNNKIESADYSTSKYYNGQDYKSTKFNSNLKDGTTLKADSYLDIAKINSIEEITNAAVDSEVRRLEVIAKSREITYANSSVMAEYKDELFTDYYMFADTPKMDINIELSNYEQGDRGYRYNVNNINFGLEERPSTKITLDKQIEEIILTTSDGNTIMDAKYNINYTVDDKGEITADVQLDKANSFGIDNLQALNRDQATNQGFRYINVDTSILEGTTVTVKYKFTALNTGEVDRTGKLATIAYTEDMKNACNELSRKFAVYTKSGNTLVNNTSFGEYVGSIYYYGANGDQSDSVVSSTVRQLVDYIDNDVSFSGMLNATSDTSWSNITVSELKQVIDPNIVTVSEDGKEIIIDSDDVQYETDNRNNIVTSVDNSDSSSTINNAGFIVELQPYSAASTTGEKYQASMYLTTRKYVSADSDDLRIDNIAEIIKYNNKVGRRDDLTVTGNQNPATALEYNIGLTTPTTVSAGMAYERDTSATEVITLAPPTGSGLIIWKLQVVGSITLGLAIIAVGIVVIKKKVLK